MTARRLFLVAALLVFAFTFAFAAPARAGETPAPDCPELPCSVIRSCSSTGMACEPQDRACAERARAQDLEIRCEQPCTSGQRFVYCPPDTGRSDSKIVWTLLSLAVVLALGGGTLLWLVLRKKDV